MKIYLMHQTHTDIGYTDRQEKIKKYHVDYLKQAIKISESIASGKKEWDGFVWNNETMWIIKQFLNSTDELWHKRLIKSIKRGHIELTGNYLNLTDLVDETVLKKHLAFGKNFAKKNDITLNTAISMDINGWTWGYSSAFYEAGIKRFYTCIHNHHGFVPFEKKHNVFYWETPEKNKILVWNGDVYNQGNVAKLTPDVLGKVVDNEFITTAIIDDTRLAYAKKWLDEYIESVKLQGYSYDFLPLMTKGLLVDNAPPNPHIIEAITRFNELYNEEYDIEMIGINTFFDKIEEMKLEIPTYKGDWTDWWSDGYMSIPKSVSLYKEAQRNYHKIISLQEKGYDFDLEKLNNLEDNLMEFSEHTFGYFSSVSEPWNKMTSKINSRNEMFAIKANMISDELLDDYNESNNEKYKCVGRPMQYKVTNPYNYERTEVVKLYINWWEDFVVENGYDLLDLSTNQAIEYQEILVDEASRREVNAYVTLKAYESKVFEIVKSPKINRIIPLDPLFTRDTRYDYLSKYLDNTVIATQFMIESPFYSLEFEKNKGITKFINKITNESLINESFEHPFLTPVYEVSKVEYKYKFNPIEMKEIRKNIGRNRKLFSSERFAGKLINTRVVENGPVLSRVQLKYETPGTIYSVIEITLYKNKPQLDFSYIVGKDTVWEPESLYLSIPLKLPNNYQTYIEKTNCLVRPRIDQLPRSLTQFYTMQSGAFLLGDNGALLISSLDAPILYMGSLKPSLIKLHGDKDLKNNDIMYSWLMNNYWETNFNTSLGGFYRYDYSLYFDLSIKSKEKALEKLKDLSNEFIVVQVANNEK